MTGSKNIKVDKTTLDFIRSLDDFDLTMLLSEISNFDWETSQLTLQFMQEALTLTGKN